ncbi:hypothetical protein ACJX0J_013669, partial [Zea mays]
MDTTGFMGGNFSAGSNEEWIQKTFGHELKTRIEKKTFNIGSLCQLEVHEHILIPVRVAVGSTVIILATVFLAANGYAGSNEEWIQKTFGHELK